MTYFHPACGAVLLALAMPANAQITTQDSATAASAEAATEGEIIVTGEKSDRTLQDTPASVAVTTSETITAQNLLSVYDILDRTPNISVDGNRTSFSIRGIDAFNVSGGGDGALASVYLDGAVLPRTALTVGPLDLYDIAQVEVFRGPQSTVQGRNALAGAVIIRTADPTYAWSGKARLLMTDEDGRRRFGAAVGGPVVDGQIAFRLAGEIARSDGLIFDRTLAQDADRRRSETVRGKLLLTPDALPGLRIVATYMHDRHQRGVTSFEFDPPFDRNSRISAQDFIDVTRVKSDIATLEAGYDIAPGLSLSSVTNYSRIRSLSVYDGDRTATPGQIGSVSDPDKTFQQELRLNIDKSWVHGLIGGYFLRDDNRDYFFSARQNLGLRRLGVDRSLLALGLPQATVDGVLALYGPGVPIANNLAQPRLTKNYAGFADLTFPITSRLRLRAGLRYDSEQQARGATQNVIIRSLPDPATLAIPAFAPIVTRINDLLRATAAAATSVEPVRTVKYQAWLPKGRPHLRYRARRFDQRHRAARLPGGRRRAEPAARAILYVRPGIYLELRTGPAQRMAGPQADGERPRLLYRLEGSAGQRPAHARIGVRHAGHQRGQVAPVRCRDRGERATLTPAEPVCRGRLQ